MSAISINLISNSTMMASKANTDQNKKVIQAQKGLTDHVADWFDTAKGVETFLKAVGLYGDWVKNVFHDQLSETGQNIQSAAKDGKRLMGGIELISKLNKVKLEVLSSTRSFKSIFFKCIECVGSAWDGIEFLHFKKILPLETSTFKMLGSVNSIALTVGMTRNSYLAASIIKDRADDLAKARPDLEVNPVARKNLMEKIAVSRDIIAKKACDLLKAISYVALGVIGILSYFFAFMVAPWIPVIASTSTVVFSIMAHFTDKSLKITERAQAHNIKMN